MSIGRSVVSRAAEQVLRIRWVVRLPIWLYRARLGFLLGSRFLMLEHVGRRSGRTRFVVLEVIDRPSPGSYVVVSGFGKRAQWFRNITAQPQVRVQLGARRPTAARAQRLAPEAARASLSRYADAHPRAWTGLRAVLEQTLGAPLDEAGTELALILFNTTTFDTPTSDTSAAGSPRHQDLPTDQQAPPPRTSTSSSTSTSRARTQQPPAEPDSSLKRPSTATAAPHHITSIRAPRTRAATNP